jgi:Antibiotic biosynthesis monooxygenase
VHAMIRRYSVDPDQVDDLAHRVDTEFAEMISAEPGFCDYQLIDCGNGTVITITMFDSEEGARHSNQMAAEWVEDSLSDMRIERTDASGGEVMVSRAANAVLEPAHH